MANETSVNSTDGIITPETSLSDKICVTSYSIDTCSNDTSAHFQDIHYATPIKTLRNRKRNLSLPTLSDSDD
jgi:hypothetical protein